MSIKRPDHYEHNNPSLPIVLGDNVKGMARNVDSLADLYLLGSVIDKLSENVTRVYVTETNKEYLLIDKTNIDNSLGWKLLIGDDLIPKGTRGQLIAIEKDDTNNIIVKSPIEFEQQWVYTSEQLARALTRGIASQQDLFTKFSRHSFGGDPLNPSSYFPTNAIPGIPEQLESWRVNSTTGAVESTLNTGSTISLISPDSYDKYIHTATLGSSANDNDVIGVVLAFYRDYNDLVPNTAFGRTDLPSFINTTDEFIPNEHSLVLTRARNNSGTSYKVTYNFGKLDGFTITNGSNLADLFFTTNNWTGVTVDVKVVRNGDVFTIQTTNFSDAPSGKGSLRFDLTVNLNSNSKLAKFKGKSSYGYVAQSQAFASYSNIGFSGSKNIIADLRNGDIYEFTSGGYVKNTERDLYEEFGARTLWRNINEKTFGEILLGRNYDVIVPYDNNTGEIPIYKTQADIQTGGYIEWRDTTGAVITDADVQPFAVKVNGVTLPINQLDRSYTPARLYGFDEGTAQDITIYISKNITTNVNSVSFANVSGNPSSNLLLNTELLAKETIVNVNTKVLLAENNAKAYADQLSLNVFKYVGDWDASVGTFPTTGNLGAIKASHLFKVSVAGTIGGITYDVGDTFYAKVDNPAQNANNWSTTDANTSQATESVRGTVALATIAEALARTNDTKALTALKSIGLILDEKKNFNQQFFVVKIKFFSVLMTASGSLSNIATFGITGLVVRVGDTGLYTATSFPLTFTAGQRINFQFDYTNQTEVNGNIVLIGRNT